MSTDRTTGLPLTPELKAWLGQTAGGLPLTQAQIMDPQRFQEAVRKGGMDKHHYAKLCAMAIGCIDFAENQDEVDRLRNVIRAAREELEEGGGGECEAHLILKHALSGQSA